MYGNQFAQQPQYNSNMQYANAYNNQYTPQPVQPTQQAQTNIVEVNGIQGAEAYRMQPNQRVALFDLNAMTLFIKVSDGAGFASVTAFEISQKSAQQEPTANTDDLEIRIKKYVEEYVNERINASTTTSTKRTSKSDERSE